ncbi:MAG: hypothetical protein HC788_00735 [Sphingopyxis sp.]|nr:hypothetical protein [Sphingopyxis sp.]
MFLATLVASPAAHAQAPVLQPLPPEEAGLWWTITGSDAPLAYAPTADAACRIQWKSYNPNATYQPPTYGDDGNASCNWIALQSGGPPNSNTILPTGVKLVCAPGYVTVQRSCVYQAGLREECSGDCNQKPVSGPATPTVGNPISVTSGYKVLAETDYESTDGLLRVERNYVSRPGEAWKLLFPGYLELSGYFRNYVTFYSKTGSKDQFVTTNGDAATWTWEVPDRSVSRRRLSMVTTPSIGCV